MKKVKRVSIWCLLLALAAGGVFTFAPMPPLPALLGKAAIGVLTVVIFLHFTRGIPMAGHRAKMLVFHLILLPGILMIFGHLPPGRLSTGFVLALTPVYYICIFLYYNKVGRCPACGKRIPLMSDDGECPKCHAVVDAEENPA